MRILKLGAAVFALMMGGALPSQADNVLTVAIETDLRGFDAVKANVLGVAGATVFNTMTERLGEWNDDLSLKPHLAESWTVAPDGMTVTFKLRKGVKFSNGKAFTARDVAAHWNRLMDPKNQYFGRLFYGPIIGAVAVDDLTVKFNLQHPWVPALSSHGSFSFGPYVPSADNVAADKQMRAPIGTGPFMMSEWRSGDRFIVDRNPYYWNPDRVKLDRIVFRMIPDQATRYAALLSGEVDVIWTDRGDTILKAQKNNKLNVYTRIGAGAGISLMNAAKAPFNNANARKAFLHAWNQGAYVGVSMKNTVPVVTHPLGPDANCADGYRRNDVAKAKEFAAAYEADTGKKIGFELIHTTTQRGREFGEITQQLGKRGGMTVTLQPVDQLQLRQRVFTNNYNMSGWRIADTGDVGPQLFALLHSKSPYNLGKYNNPKMDGLVVAMRVAPTQKLRAAATCAVVQQMNDDGPIVLTNGRQHYAITSKAVSALPTLFQGIPDVRFVSKN